MIYTFYSYKGGVGRSMALVNIAELMCSAGLEVLIVDWDLEAPGLERFFPDPVVKHVLNSPGVIDMLLAYKDRISRFNPEDKTPLFPIYNVKDYWRLVHTDPNSSGQLWLLPAGRRAENQILEYSNLVKIFDWQDFYQNWEGEIYFEWLREQFEELADVVLIDSRTGVTEMGGVCTYQLADVVVLLCAANMQSLDGTLQMLKSFSSPQLHKLRNRKLSTLVVPARIERTAEIESLNEFRQKFANNFAPYLPAEIQVETDFFIDLEIPYVPLYAFAEIIAVNQINTRRSVEMEQAYNGLFQTLCKFAPPDSKIFEICQGLDVGPRDRVSPPDEEKIYLTCPYPGMEPFSAKAARFFYGRDEEIRKLYQYLRYQRLFFVIGPSGSGKSSLIRAGLLPKLKHQDFWLVREMRPGSQPYQVLAETIEGDPAQPTQTVTALLARQPPAQCLLLIIDQFEELFTHAERVEQSRFFAALQALRAVENCALLMVMRADFYPDLMNSDLWPVKPNQRLEIAPLRGKALRQAIQKPAEDVGLHMEAELVERLLADAADEPGALPMVQETMVLLWEEMRDNQLTLNTYERLGGEGRSGLAVAMATKADAALDRLSPPQQAIARRIFLRLIQFGEGRADTRRQLPVSVLKVSGDDPTLFEQMLNHLTNYHLLTLSGEVSDGDRRVDIAHEALISGWPTLQGWLSERREAEQTRRRLEAKAMEWIRLGRGSGGLLDEVGLLEAERWLDSPDAADLGYSEGLSVLVQASRAAIEEAKQRRRLLLQGISEKMVEAGLNPDDVLVFVAQVANDVSHSDLTGISLYDQTSSRFIRGVRVPRIGEVEQVGLNEFPDPEGFVAEIAKAQEAIFVPNVEKSPPKTLQFAKMRGIQAFAGLPLTVGRQGRRTTVGVLFVNFKQPHSFSEEEQEILRYLANQAAVAIAYADIQAAVVAKEQLSVLGTATAAIQHRINNTLSIIGPNVDRLYKRVDTSDETIRDILDIIKRNVKYTSDYINRIQKPLKETELQLINLNASLHGARDWVWAQYQDKAEFETVKVAYNLDESLPLLEASSGQITEVFRNLIENSYKAMVAAGGVITISSRQAEGWLEVEIQDTGPGIPPNIRDKLFTRPVPSRQPGQMGQGAGLGLWLSALLLQKYSGEIKIAQTGPGGTTVLVRLPAAKR